VDENVIVALEREVFEHEPPVGRQAVR